MADKTVTIKNATNKELTSLLFRLRQEHEALRLTRELKIKSVPNPNGRYPSYSIPEGFSTETLVANGKSIKTMTDEELALFLDRLRNEDEVARIIADIREMNTPFEPYSDNQSYEGISMDTPVDDLYHFGIPGMKWGVRRARGADGKVKSNGSADHQEAKALKKKGYKNLSNKELKDLTKRMQLEQNFRNLKSQDQQKGLDFVKTLTAMGTTVATAYALSQTPLGKDIAKSIKVAMTKG